MPAGPTALTEKTAGVPGQRVVLTGSATIVGVVPPQITLVVSVTELSDSSKSFSELKICASLTREEPATVPRETVPVKVICPLVPGVMVPRSQNNELPTSVALIGRLAGS